MYAVIKTGGKQYRVEQGGRLRVEKLDAAEGDDVAFDKVLLVGEGADVKVGKPYIDGGKVIQSFLRAGLIQQLIITRIPVLIGSGIPLFGLLDEDIALEHVATKVFAPGMVQSTYEVPQ